MSCALRLSGTESGVHSRHSRPRAHRPSALSGMNQRREHVDSWSQKRTVHAKDPGQRSVELVRPPMSHIPPDDTSAHVRANEFSVASGGPGDALTLMSHPFDGTAIHDTGRLLASVLESEGKPVRTKDNGTGEHQEDQKQNDPAATPCARHPSTKAKPLLQPVKNPVEEREFEQTRETARFIAHFLAPFCLLPDVRYPS